MREHVYVSEKIIKMRNFFGAIFDKIPWAIVQDLNQLKFSMQHKYMYMYQKKL